MQREESQTIEAYIATEKTLPFYKEAFKKYTITGIDQFAWHWSWWAMFGGVFYLLYRKLYIEALAYFLLFASVGMIPLAGLLMWIISGGVLPYFVYKRYQKTKAQVEENISGEAAQLEALSVVGGVNKWAIWLAVALHLIMWIVALNTVMLVSSMPR